MRCLFFFLTFTRRIRSTGATQGLVTFHPTRHNSETVGTMRGISVLEKQKKEAEKWEKNDGALE